MRNIKKNNIKYTVHIFILFHVLKGYRTEFLYVIIAKEKIKNITKLSRCKYDK